MKKLLLIIPLLLIAGCTNKEPNIGLEVPIKTSGCTGFAQSFSDVTVNSDGLAIVSNIISPTPCFTLTTAEISRSGDDVTVYFTFKEESGPCNDCTGVQSMIYTIFGDGLNKTGVNLDVIGLFGDQEVKHSFTS